MSRKHCNRHGTNKKKRYKDENKRKEKDEKKRKKKDEKNEKKRKKKDEKKRREMLFLTSLRHLGGRYHNSDMMKKGLEAMLEFYKSDSNSNSTNFRVPDEYLLKFTSLCYWYEFCFGKDEETSLLSGFNDLDDEHKLLFLQLS